MKSGIKVKVTGTLKTDWYVICFLFCLSVIFFLLSFILEFIPFSEEVVNKYHIGYMSNVFLAVCGSSIISFVCLYIPFLNNKREQLSNIIAKLKFIYWTYKGIQDYISRVSAGEEKNNNYSIDKKVYNLVNNLESNINELLLLYDNSQICSITLNSIIKILKTDILLNLYIIKSFYLITIPEKFMEDSFVPVSQQAKDIIDKYAKEYYQALLKSIDGIISIRNLDFHFSPLINNDYTKDIQNFSYQCFGLGIYYQDKNDFNKIKNEEKAKLERKISKIKEYYEKT